MRNLLLMSREPKNDLVTTLMSILKTMFHPDGLLSVSLI